MLYQAEEQEGWEAGSTIAAAAASPGHINSPSMGMPLARLVLLPPHLAFPGVSSDPPFRPQSWAYCEAQTGRAPQHYFHVLGVAPGLRGLRWALRQRLVQGLLLYPDSSWGGLRSPLFPAKYVLAELGRVHTTPTGGGHAEPSLKQPF